MLKAGFARIDATPPFGADLAGYFYRRFAKGILDPLYLNAVAVANEEKTVLLISADYIGIKLDANIEIRNLISERTGVAVDHILLAALHQHTSCAIDKNRASGLKDEEFKNVLFRKFADVAQMAIDDLKDARLGHAAKETAEPIAFVRRYFADDGTVHTNPNTAKVNIVKRCDDADNTVRIIRFARDDAKDIAIVNFSTHPDVIGGESFSADWLGHTRRFVESDNGDVSCIVFTGTQGDSNHVDYFKPADKRYKGTRYEHSKYMGRSIADVVREVWSDIELTDNSEIYSETAIVYNKTNTEGIDDYDKYKAWYSDYEAGRLDYKPHITELAYASRIIRLRNAPILRQVPLTVIGVGDTVMVGFGGEPFTAYSAAARALAPEKFVMTAVCANGYEGYFPTEKAFAEGGYEAKSSLFTPSLECEIIDKLKEMIKV